MDEDEIPPQQPTLAIDAPPASSDRARSAATPVFPTLDARGEVGPTVAQGALATHDRPGLQRPPSAAALPIVAREQYVVEGEHARGGMGRILKADDVRLGRPVALKELHGSLLGAEARFVREALVTARLQHPAIVPVYEAGRWPDGVPFYAMKLVSGEPLSETIRQGRTLAARLALLPHVITVAEAIAYAHSQRIIHRDLKPANVLVGAFGETVVVDWGLAKDLTRRSDDAAARVGAGASVGAHPTHGASDASGVETVVGTVVGTPNYMSPEQARGEIVDERTDVYALGAILYYLLAGSPPHSGSTAAEVLSAVLNKAPTPLETLVPEAPKELVAIVAKAMATKAADRYPSAQELAVDLRRFHTGQLVSVHTYTMRELLRRWLRRHRGPVAVATVLTLALAAALGWGYVATAAERDKARREARKAEQINVFLREMLSSTDPRVQGRDVTVAQALDAAAARIDTELRDEPEIQAAVQLTIGQTYFGLGRYEPAETHLEEALATRRRLFGDRSAEVAIVLQSSGLLRAEKGDLDTAQRQLREAVAIQEYAAGPDSDAAASARNDLGHVLQLAGDQSGAERIYRELLERQRRVKVEATEEVAVTLNNLGVVLGYRGAWADAAAMHREAVAIMRRTKGEHPDTASALSQLAGDLDELKHYDAAEAAYREALSMRKKLLGPEHPDVSWTAYNYAYMLRKKGDPAAALALCREVLALRGKTLPDGHPMVASTLQVLGSSLQDQGDHAAAEAALRESLRLREENLPGTHWLLATARSALGECLTKRGRFAEAEPLLRAGYDSLKAARGEEHERTLEARQRLAALYVAWGKPAEAAALGR